jgi:glycosyltransferase involved in cell wall biosynthesis
VKIAFVSTILRCPWGGADTLWTRAAEAAQVRGDTLLILVSPAVAGHARLAALAAAGAQVSLRRPFPDVPSLRLRLQRKLDALFQPGDRAVAALQRFRPDLVVFSFGGTYDFLAEPAIFGWLKASKTPYRIVANWQAEHPNLPDAARRAAADILGRADAVFFVSERNRQTTRRHLLADLPNARVIHNPLRWRAADVPPWPDGPKWGLATVGRLDHGKGVHLLLSAAAQVLASEPDWHLEVYGQGPEESYLRDLASRSGLGDRVRFRGYVPELRAIWEKNHLLISPAIDDGVPMTIPEAMLCDRPVLATCVGGAEEWISDGKTGFLCPAPTLPLLAAALQRAWEARLSWAAMGRAAAAQTKAFYRREDHLLLIRPL